MEWFVVTLGDLYADGCVVCNARAFYGIASKRGPEGCVEAIKEGRTYCEEHLPEPPKETEANPLIEMHLSVDPGMADSIEETE